MNFDYGDANAGNEEILIHEMAHSNPLFNTRRPLRRLFWSKEKKQESPYYGIDYGNVPEDWKYLLKPSNAKNEHDVEMTESYSDLQGLRYLLYKNGIWDASNPEHDFGEDEYNKLL